MATRKYGIDKGALDYTVTEGAGSATTKGMELTIDLAKFTKFDKLLVLNALEEIKKYIIHDTWVPA